MEKPKKFTQEQIDGIYWRYKKKTPPEDDFGSAAGPVKSFFVCSKCKLDCGTRAELKSHWDLEH